jgi:hypothetical protein
MSHASVLDCSHGRSVEQIVSVFAAPAELLPTWIGLTSVIMVNRTGTRANQPFTETVYYLSDRCLSADTYMALIRGHWAIENRLHWVKDVTSLRIIRPDWVVMLQLIGQLSSLGLSL